MLSDLVSFLIIIAVAIFLKDGLCNKNCRDCDVNKLCRLDKKKLKRRLKKQEKEF